MCWCSDSWLFIVCIVRQSYLFSIVCGGVEFTGFYFVCAGSDSWFSIASVEERLLVLY